MRCYLLCCFLLMAVSAFCQKNLVRSADGEFQIQLPAAWFRLNSSTAELQRYVPDEKDNNFSSTEINVQIRPRPADIQTIEELAAANETVVKSQFGDMLKINESRYEIKDGRKWWRLEAAVNVPGTTGYNLWLQATLGNNETYLVSFAALADDYAKYKPLMESALASAKITATSLPAGSNTNIAINPANNRQVAGSIAPGAIKLDVDEMRFFFGKYTVMRKGDQEALYDDNMKEIMPFGKYTYPSVEPYVHGNVERSYNGGTWLYRSITPSWFGTNGIFNANAKPTKLMGFFERSKDGMGGRTGFIDQNGKVVFENPGDYDAEGYRLSVNNNVMVSKKFDGTVITGKANTLRAFTQWPEAGNGYYEWSGGLRATRASESASEYPELSRSVEEANKRVGYVNRKGEFQVKPTYHKVAEFSEGIAFVCRKDQYGVEKWGAIDTAGNLLIPFQYGSQPGRFSNGRSLIKAIDASGTGYAMIDRTGKIRFTIPSNYNDSIVAADFNAPALNPGPEKFLFSYGYTFVTVSTKAGRELGERDNLFLLDTNGRYIPIKQLLRKNFPNGESIDIMSRIQHNQFLFKVSSNEKEGIGIADVNGNILIAPVFSKLALFEPESKLQYAELDKRTLADKQDTNKGIEGYIDRQGVFQVIRNLKKAPF